MTRYSFVLLLARVVGVLSLVGILNALQVLTASWKVLASAAATEEHWPLAPVIAITAGIVVSLAGCSAGLVGRHLARPFLSQTELSTKLLPLLFAASVSWFMVDQMCLRMVSVSALTWNLLRLSHGNLEGNKFAEMMMGGQGLHGNPLAEACWITVIVLIAFSALVAYALRQPEEDFSH